MNRVSSTFEYKFNNPYLANLFEDEEDPPFSKLWRKTPIQTSQVMATVGGNPTALLAEEGRHTITSSQLKNVRAEHVEDFLNYYRKSRAERDADEIVETEAEIIGKFDDSIDDYITETTAMTEEDFVEEGLKKFDTEIQSLYKRYTDATKFNGQFAGIDKLLYKKYLDAADKVVYAYKEKIDSLSLFTDESSNEEALSDLHKKLQKHIDKDNEAQIYPMIEIKHKANEATPNFKKSSSRKSQLSKSNSKQSSGLQRSNFFAPSDVKTQQQNYNRLMEMEAAAPSSKLANASSSSSVPVYEKKSTNDTGGEKQQQTESKPAPQPAPKPKKIVRHVVSNSSEVKEAPEEPTTEAKDDKDTEEQSATSNKKTGALTTSIYATVIKKTILNDNTKYDFDKTTLTNASDVQQLVDAIHEQFQGNTSFIGKIKQIDGASSVYEFAEKLKLNENETDINKILYSSDTFNDMFGKNHQHSYITGEINKGKTSDVIKQINARLDRTIKILKTDYARDKFSGANEDKIENFAVAQIIELQNSILSNGFEILVAQPETAQNLANALKYSVEHYNDKNVVMKTTKDVRDFLIDNKINNENSDEAVMKQAIFVRKFVGLGYPLKSVFNQTTKEFTSPEAREKFVSETKSINRNLRVLLNRNETKTAFGENGFVKGAVDGVVSFFKRGSEDGGYDSTREEN